MLVFLVGVWGYWMIKVAVDNSDFGGNLTRLRIILNYMVYTNLRRRLNTYWLD